MLQQSPLGSETESDEPRRDGGVEVFGFLLIRPPPEEENQAPHAHVDGEVAAEKFYQNVNDHGREEEPDGEREAVLGEGAEPLHAQQGDAAVHEGVGGRVGPVGVAEGVGFVENPEHQRGHHAPHRGPDDLAEEHRARRGEGEACKPNVGKLAKPQSSPPAKNHWKAANKKLNEKVLKSTATCDAGGSNDAGLNNGVLLPGERLHDEPHPVESGGPELDHTEREQSGGDVERRNHAGGEIELTDDEVEHQTQHEASHHGSHRQLLLPRRNLRVPENILRRCQLLVLRLSSAVAFVVSQPFSLLHYFHHRRFQLLNEPRRDGGGEDFGFLLICPPPEEENQAPHAHVDGEVAAEVEWDGHAHGVRNEAIDSVISFVLPQQFYQNVDDHGREEEPDGEREAVLGERVEPLHAQQGDAAVHEGVGGRVGAIGVAERVGLVENPEHQRGHHAPHRRPDDLAEEHRTRRGEGEVARLEVLHQACKPNVGKLAKPQSSPPAKNHWKAANKKLNEKVLKSTATCDAGGSNDAGLNNGVLLPGERLHDEPHPVESGGPELDHTEREQSGGDVERRNHAGGEIELTDDEVEHQTQHEASHHGSHRQLLLPRRNLRVPENILRRRQLLVLRFSSAVAFVVSQPFSLLHYFHHRRFQLLSTLL
nr:uncharacterized protein LOC21412289 [Ipomoea trifida]